jgi:translocator protein
MKFRILIFLILNFSALIAGVSLYGEGGNSEWYNNLTKAPWEPPGWVFGAAWTIIMICFAFYMSITWKYTVMKKN